MWHVGACLVACGEYVQASSAVHPMGTLPLPLPPLYHPSSCTRVRTWTSTQKSERLILKRCLYNRKALRLSKRSLFVPPHDCLPLTHLEDRHALRLAHPPLDGMGRMPSSAPARSKSLPTPTHPPPYAYHSAVHPSLSLRFIPCPRDHVSSRHTTSPGTAAHA